MIKLIDYFLNNITMYRLVLYYLICLVIIALIYSCLGIIAFNPITFSFSILLILITCLLTNYIFSKVFEAPVNFESAYISALILSLIINPINGFHDIFFLGWAAVFSMASKYILAIGKKHLFNPVALTVFLTSITINQSASWWVGNSSMLPWVLIGGLLIARKIRRFNLIVSFLLVSLTTSIILSLFKNSNPMITLQKAILDSPLIFFAFVMLTEPLTTPPLKKLQVIYGSLVGFLFSPQLHIGPLFTTPESALLIGNIFSYLVSPKFKLILKLQEKLQIAPDIVDFIFKPDQKIAYLPGQYLEWTLPQDKTDSRGNRRYFTLASSPTENNLRIGVKFYSNSSSFKKTLFNKNSQIVASQLSGEFTLPKDLNKKLVFIAGGIGITPFRSMLKYLIDTGESRDITLFYSNKLFQDIVYKEIFEQAKSLGVKIIYTLTDQENIPQGWNGEVGYITKEMIQKYLPNFKEYFFYLSGPHSLVMAFEETLSQLAVNKDHIKVDFFPGFT